MNSLINSGKIKEAEKQLDNFEPLTRMHYEIKFLLIQFQFVKLSKLLEKAISLAISSNTDQSKLLLEKFRMYNVFVYFELDILKAKELYEEIKSQGYSDDPFSTAMGDYITGMLNGDLSSIGSGAERLKIEKEFIMYLFAIANQAHLVGGIEGIELLNNAIKLYKELGNSNFISIIKCLKGYLYQTLGDYKSARILNTDAYDEAVKNSYSPVIINASNCLGSIAMEEGNIQEAMFKFHVSSDGYIEQHGYNIGTYALLEVYRLGGEYEKAIELAIDTLDTSMAFLPLIKSRVLLQIALLMAELNNFDKKREFLERLQKIGSETKDELILNVIKFAEALILKQSKNLRSTYKAQEILTELINKDIPIYHIRVEIIKHYCELILLEYEIYEQPDLLEEVEKYIAELGKIAEDQNLIRLKFEVEILRSKISLLKEDQRTAGLILNDLLQYSKEHNLSIYEKIVSSELKELEENYKKWLDLVEGNPTMRELVTQSKIRDYITKAINVMDDFNGEQ